MLVPCRWSSAATPGYILSPSFALGRAQEITQIGMASGLLPPGPLTA